MKTPLISEQELIFLLKAKDKKGFNLLHSCYSKVLYDIIFKIVHDPELAKDVLQDSFIKIWQHTNEYDATKGSLFTWILNIARNQAIDTTRSRSYKRNSCTYTLKQGKDTTDKHLYLQQAIDGIGIEKHLLRLKQEHQQMIVFIYLQGFTQQEAAKQLDIPLGTAKSRVKSAIHQLRLLLL